MNALDLAASQIYCANAIRQLGPVGWRSRFSEGLAPMPFKDPEKRREMARIYCKRYFHSEKGKLIRAAAVRRYAERHPEAVKARLAVRVRRYCQTEKGYAKELRHRERSRVTGQQRARVAVRVALGAGILTRQPCLECGALPVHAHHFLGYVEEHWLDVVWLCPLHHARAHTLMREGMTSGSVSAEE